MNPHDISPKEFDYNLARVYREIEFCEGKFQIHDDSNFAEFCDALVRKGELSIIVDNNGARWYCRNDFCKMEW